MVDQDPHSGPVAGDSGHGMMVTTSEAKLIDGNEELIRAMGGINEDVPTGINEAEWKWSGRKKTH